MKYMTSQLIYLFRTEGSKRNIQLLLRFFAVLIALVTTYSILFHYIMEWEGKQFSWVTDLVIVSDNARHLVRGGRSRWKIENETFNTLKNQGYHFEHNYGHGTQNLSVVFAMLMMLTFLVDQTQQLCCPLFQAVHKKLGSRRLLWDHLRSHFRHIRFVSMQHLYEVMHSGAGKELPSPASFSSRRVRAP